MGKLTVRGIDSAKARDKAYKLADGDGLQLRVAADGTKTWLVRYVIAGTERQYRLPQQYRSSGGDGYCTLQEARDEAVRIRARARHGIDIQVELERSQHAEAAQQEQTRTTNLTVQDMFDAWIADGVRRKDGNLALIRGFTVDVLPAVGAIPVKDVTEHDLRGVLRALVDRDVNRTAVMIRDQLTQMFAWARKRQPWRKLMVEGDPMDLIEIEKIVAPDFDLDYYGTRVLSDAEITELHQILAARQAEYDAAPNKRIVPQPLEVATQCAIWIMLSTLCRVGETSMARWEHVDFAAGTWFLPKANVKDSISNLTVFLSAFTLRQFRRLHERTGHTAWCFPARDGEDHIDVKAITKQITDRQWMFKMNKDGTPRKPLKNRVGDDTLVLGGGTNGAWTSHDLRRTGATMMQKLGVQLDTIDRCQNHVIAGSKVRRHYLHHDYAEEKRMAWAALGGRLDALIESA